MTPEARLRQRVRFPVLALTAAAWVALLLVGMPHVIPRAESEGVVPALGGDIAAAHAHLSVGPDPHAMPLRSLLVGSVLMLVAMMAPLLIPALRHVLDRTVPARRGRSAALLTLGYAGTWLVVWTMLLVLASTVHRVAGPTFALVLGISSVLAWQVSPIKQRALNRCHSRPALGAFGRAADVDALRFGTWLAVRCIGSCWALMLLPLLVPAHQLLTMVIVALWMWGERLEPPTAPGWRLRVPTRTTRILLAQATARARGSTGLRSRA